MRKARGGFPIRLFQWLLVGLVIAAIAAENIGGNAMSWHFSIGYAVPPLLAFRILWGIIGSHYARFSSSSVRLSAWQALGPASRS